MRLKGSGLRLGSGGFVSWSFFFWLFLSLVSRFCFRFDWVGFMGRFDDGFVMGLFVCWTIGSLDGWIH